MYWRGGGGGGRGRGRGREGEGEGEGERERERERVSKSNIATVDEGHTNQSLQAFFLPLFGPHLPEI